MHKRIILLSVATLVLLFVIGLYLLSQFQKPKTQLPQTVSDITFKSLVPGKSTKEEILDALGTPKKEDVVNQNKTLLEYDSDSSVYNNQITVDNGVVDIIKEIVTLKNPKYSQEIKKVYGEPKYFLYGSDSYAGFNLYIYPENGIAYLGNPHTGLLLEIWYFPPTTFEVFKEKYATGYSETLEERQ